MRKAGQGTSTKPYYASSYPKPGKVFHRSDTVCEWGRKKKKSNRREFDTHDAAIEAGYKPCKTCKA